MEAKLHVANTSLGQRAFIAQNVIHGAMELTNIDSIIELIEQTLVGLYVERTAIEQQLPVTMGAITTHSSGARDSLLLKQLHFVAA